MKLPALLLLGGCLPGLPVVDDPCARFPDGGGLYKFEIDRDDSSNRKPYVYVPPGPGPRDVVYLLHGRGGDGPSFAEQTGMLRLADQLNVVVVYPTGLGFVNTWNASPDHPQTQDDVDFLETLAKELDTRVCARRNLGIGFSNGSMMMERWGCQGTELDAIGTSSGQLMIDNCRKGPLPMRHYHGTVDNVVPIEGGDLRGLDIPPLDTSMAVWRKKNQCTDDPPEVETTGDTTCTRWSCEAPTELCIIEGWGHQWPGGTSGVRTDADATNSLLRFFDQSVPLPVAEE